MSGDLSRRDFLLAASAGAALAAVGASLVPAETRRQWYWITLTRFVDVWRGREWSELVALEPCTVGVPYLGRRCVLSSNWGEVRAAAEGVWWVESCEAIA